MDQNQIIAIVLLLASGAFAYWQSLLKPKTSLTPKPPGAQPQPQPVPAPVNPPQPPAIDWRVLAGQTLFRLIDDFEKNGLPEGAALIRQAGTKLYEGKKSE